MEWSCLYLTLYGKDFHNGSVFILEAELSKCCCCRTSTTLGLDWLHNFSQKCMQLKPSSSSNGLMGLLIGILGEHPEVVLAECSKRFGS
ncbi:nuclear pore complex protein NUP85-like [Elaeis guineensis]|uniref:nuclear pore complex protein NUP85-like n=1 Tax=Elaeis guineensis var. tenera TaxID=51953 RepID=UPI003C6D161B